MIPFCSSGCSLNLGVPRVSRGGSDHCPFRSHSISLPDLKHGAECYKHYLIKSSQQPSERNAIITPCFTHEDVGLWRVT